MTTADINAAFTRLRAEHTAWVATPNGDPFSTGMAAGVLLAMVPPGSVLVAVTEADLDDGLDHVYDAARRALAGEQR